MKRGVPIFSQAAREMCERGPTWREHPDYWAPDDPDEDEPGGPDAELVPENDGKAA